MKTPWVGERVDGAQFRRFVGDEAGDRGFAVAPIESSPEADQRRYEGADVIFVKPPFRRRCNC
jgi:hypothetical protein